MRGRDLVKRTNDVCGLLFWWRGTYLSFSCVAIMVRDTNLVEETVELANNGVDLLGEITRIHPRKADVGYRRSG